MNVSVEMFTYANALGEEKRLVPTDDIVTAIVNAEVDGERLSDIEFDMFFMLLSVAGNETTRNAITHGMLAFLEYRDQWERLREDPELFDLAAEEIVRWASPVIYFRRSVTHDVELRGQQLKAGDKITVWYPSANRDDDVFERPFEFDVGRTPNPHLGFGGRGPHFCLGSNLARLEIKALFEELTRRVPTSPRRSRPRDCGRTSSTASSTCRCNGRPRTDRFRRPRRGCRRGAARAHHRVQHRSHRLRRRPVAQLLPASRRRRDVCRARRFTWAATP